MDHRRHPQHQQQLQQPPSTEQRRSAVPQIPSSSSTQYHRPCAVIGPDRQPYPTQRHGDVSVRHQSHQLQPAQHQPHQVYAPKTAHPYERYDINYQPVNRDATAYNVEYDYQRYQQAQVPQVCQKLPYDYSNVAYPRAPIAARYEPYPQPKEKYAHYQYPYPNPYAFVDQRKRKTQAEEAQYCQVQRHAQPFCPVPKVQPESPCGMIDVNQKFAHHVGPVHSRSKQFMSPYDVNTINSKVIPDPTKMKMDYYNYYRPQPSYPNMHFPNESYHPANYNISGYDYGARSSNIHYQNPMYYKPVEYRQMDKSYEMDVGPHKYYNSKYMSGNPLAKIPTEFSPNIISPAGSNTSFDSMAAANPYQNLQEEGGYMSQCSTVSRQSAEYQMNSKKEFYNQSCSRSYQNPNSLETLSLKTNIIDKSQQPASKESLDLRKFLEMWDEEYEEPKVPNKEITSAESINSCLQTKIETEKAYVPELYVLDKTVISEEDAKKYEHVQKVTKLPDYIKDVNVTNAKTVSGDVSKDPNITFPSKLQTKKGIHPVYNSYQSDTMKVPQPELFTNEFEDVEAKISQSVIHKEVRCNFEIKPLIPNNIVVPQNSTLSVDDHKVKTMNPNSVPYNNVQMLHKSEKSANTKMDKKIHHGVLNDNYVNLQNSVHEKKNYPSIANTNIKMNYKNMPGYNLPPIINSDEPPMEIPIHHKKSEMHYAKPNPIYPHNENLKISHPYSGNTHGKVNVIMNSAYADYKHSQRDGHSIINSSHGSIKNPHIEYKNINPIPQQQQIYGPPESYNMNYMNKLPSQNNYFNISINSEKKDPHYHKYDEQYPLKPDRTSDSKYVKPHEEKNINNTTSINIALLLNENKKTDVESANRTVICRNDSNSFNKNNQENYEQYLDSKSGVLYSGHNASITIQIEKRDESEYPNVPSTILKEPANTASLQKFPVEDTAYVFPQNQHLEQISHNNHHSYHNNNTDKSYELKIYETASDDLRTDKQSIIVHSSCQQNNSMYLPQEFITHKSEDLNCEKNKIEQNNEQIACESNIENNIRPSLTDCQYEELFDQSSIICTSKPSVIDMSLKSNKNSSVIVKSSEISSESTNTVISSVINHENISASEDSITSADKEISNELSLINNNNIKDVITNSSKNTTSSLILDSTMEVPTEQLPKCVSEVCEDGNGTQNSESSAFTTTDFKDTLVHNDPELLTKLNPISDMPTDNINKNTNMEYSGLLDDLSLSSSHDSSTNSQSDSSDNPSDSSEIRPDYKVDVPEESEPQSVSEENKILTEEKNECDFKETHSIRNESFCKEDESDENEPLIDFQDSLTSNFTKNCESDRVPHVIISKKDNDEMLIENKSSFKTHQKEIPEFDEFQMVLEQIRLKEGDDDREKSKDVVSEISNTNFSKNELSEDDNDGISFQNNDCGVILEEVSVDDHEAYISFESDKGDFFCGDSDDDARYVIIRTDEPLSYAAIDSENDLSSDIQINRTLDDADVSREDIEMSLSETRDKLNMTDGNEIEVGGYWIDDIACVETVAAEETIEAEGTVETEEFAEDVNECEESPISNLTYIPDENLNDSAESCKSPSVVWSEHSSNDESNSASIDYDDNSREELLRDSNSNFITSHKEHTTKPEETPNFDKYFPLIQLQNESNLNNSCDSTISTVPKNPIIKMKLGEKSEYKYKSMENKTSEQSKHSKKRHNDEKYKSTDNHTKRKKYSSNERVKSDSSKTDQSIKIKYNSSSKASDKNLKHKSSSESKSNKHISQLDDEKADSHDRSHSRNRMTLPKKPPKPKFEDVLRNLDEANMSLMKMKLKKQKKKSIPKVIIKRNEEGSHYTSTSNKTNKSLVVKNKWQPKVYLRRHNSIEKLVKSK